MQASRFLPLISSLVTLLPSLLLAQPDLGVASYNSAAELLYPEDTATWVHMGSVMGGQYNDEVFDPARPGVFGVVQLEPEAYRYFLENGEYANGTMFLLSFYGSEAKSDPQLQGFVQGELRAREIHVIDKARFAEGRGFFMFDNADQTSSPKVADGSECVACHTSEADYDGTFTQFYPVMRSKL